MGAPRKPFTWIFDEGRDPSNTPATDVISLISKDKESEEIEDILLYVSVLNPDCWYLTIVSVLIPTNCLPVEVTVDIPPLATVIEIWEIPPGKANLSKIESALKSE